MRSSDDGERPLDEQRLERLLVARRPVRRGRKRRALHGRVAEVHRPREAVDLRSSRSASGPRTPASWLPGGRTETAACAVRSNGVPAVELRLVDGVGRAVVAARTSASDHRSSARTGPRPCGLTCGRCGRTPARRRCRSRRSRAGRVLRLIFLIRHSPRCSISSRRGRSVRSRLYLVASVLVRADSGKRPHLRQNPCHRDAHDATEQHLADAAQALLHPVSLS